MQTAKQDVITIKNPAGSVPLMVGTDLYAIKANSPLSIITDSTNGQYVLNADLSAKADLSWVTSQLGNKLSYLAFGNPTGGYPMGSGSNIIYGLTGAGPITLAPNAGNTCVDIRFDGTQVSTLAVSGASTFNNNVTVATGKTLTVGGTTALNDNVTVLAGKTLNTDNLKCVTNTGLSTGVLTVGDNLTSATGKTLTVNGTTSLKDNVTITGGKTLYVDKLTASADPTGITINSDIACSGIISTDSFGSNVATAVTIVDDVIFDPSKKITMGTSGAILTDSLKCVTNQGTTGAIAVADHMTLSTGETFTVPNLTVNGTVTGAGFFSNFFIVLV